MRIVSLVIFSLVGAAFAEDVKGSKDHPLVGRYVGSTITKYSVKGYEELNLVAKPVLKYADRDKPEMHSLPVSGKLTRILYEGPEERSVLEVVRNYQKKLEGEGFITQFFCRTAECGEAPAFWTVANDGSGLRSQWDSNTYLLTRRTSGGSDIWVSVMGVEFGGTATKPLTPQVLVTVVEAQAMEEDKIEVKDASAIGSALESAGKIAIYGIYFDVDKATLKAESRPQLEQIAKLLNDRPALNVLIVGHTDSSGSLEYNRTLSEQRASAVKAALTGEFRISDSRLTPVGVGMAAPVASNRDEAGRAKNRRVEIVER
jgi:outer membrane protein OmpA-like peptidoglycan-associated protein